MKIAKKDVGAFWFYTVTIVVALFFLLAHIAAADPCSPLQKALAVELDDGTQCSPVITWVDANDLETGEAQRIELVLVAPPLCCRADFNADGRVNFLDLARLAGGMFGSDELLDLDADGRVNFADLGLIRTVFFQSCEANE